MTIGYIFLAIAAVAVVLLGSSVRVITQFERGVVFRFGQLRSEIRGPGLALIVPFVDRLQKVNMGFLLVIPRAHRGWVGTGSAIGWREERTAGRFGMGGSVVRTRGGPPAGSGDR